MDAKDMNRFQHNREKRKYKIFQEILNRCLVKVKNAAKHNRTEQVYKVPVFLIGKPLYNLEACLCYLLVNLRNKGFVVYYYIPNILYISWKKGLSYDEKYQTYLLENAKGIVKN